MFSLIISAINTDNILHSLGLFWKGMLAVMIVLALVCFVTFALTRVVVNIDAAKAKKKAAEENNDNTQAE